MSTRIAICDDTAYDIAQLKEALYSYNPAFEITSYADGQTLIDDLANNRRAIDILFLDICMPGTDGIKTAERIRSIKKDIMIIFVTSSRDFYSQAYEVFAFNYIVKPLDREKLYRILDQATDVLKRENHQKIQFKYKSTIYNLDCRDILYIESRDKLILFYKTDGQVLQCYGKLDTIENELPPRSFIRCHQSFLVNASCITEMGDNYFRVGQVVISISKKFFKSAKEQYYSYLFSHMSKGRLR